MTICRHVVELYQALWARLTTTTKRTMMESMKEVLSFSPKGSGNSASPAVLGTARWNSSFTIFVTFSTTSRNFALALLNNHSTTFVEVWESVLEVPSGLWGTLSPSVNFTSTIVQNSKVTISIWLWTKL